MQSVIQPLNCVRVRACIRVQTTVPVLVEISRYRNILIMLFAIQLALAALHWRVECKTMPYKLEYLDVFQPTWTSLDVTLRTSVSHTSTNPYLLWLDLCAISTDLSKVFLCFTFVTFVYKSEKQNTQQLEERKQNVLSFLQFFTTNQGCQMISSGKNQTTKKIKPEKAKQKNLWFLL